MQTMQRNIIVFIILSALILGGWFWFVTDMNTEAEKKRLAQIAKDKEKEPKKKIPDPEVKPPEGTPPENKLPDKKTPVKDEPSKSETLAGEGYHLTVTTTTRGAGIRKVVLNRFDSADSQGRPILDKDGK